MKRKEKNRKEKRVSVDSDIYEILWSSHQVAIQFWVIQIISNRIKFRTIISMNLINYDDHLFLSLSVSMCFFHY